MVHHPLLFVRSLSYLILLSFKDFTIYFPLIYIQLAHTTLGSVSYAHFEIQYHALVFQEIILSAYVGIVAERLGTKGESHEVMKKTGVEWGKYWTTINLCKRSPLTLWGTLWQERPVYNRFPSRQELRPSLYYVKSHCRQGITFLPKDLKLCTGSRWAAKYSPLVCR